MGCTGKGTECSECATQLLLQPELEPGATLKQWTLGRAHHNYVEDPHWRGRVPPKAAIRTIPHPEHLNAAPPSVTRSEPQSNLLTMSCIYSSKSWYHPSTATTLASRLPLLFHNCRLGCETPLLTPHFHVCSACEIGWRRRRRRGPSHQRSKPRRRHIEAPLSTLSPKP